MSQLRYGFVIILCVCFFQASAATKSGKQQKTASSTNSINTQYGIQGMQQLATKAGNNLLNFLAKNGIKPQPVKLAKTSGLIQSTKLTTAQLQNKTLPKIVPSKIKWNKTFGTPRLIEYSIPMRNNSTSSNAPQVNSITVAKQFFADNKVLLKISDPDSEFKLVNSSVDKQGFSHVRFQQQYKGIEVWARDVYVHIDRTGQLASFNGVYAPTPSIDTAVNVNSASALNTALDDLRAKGFNTDMPEAFKKLFHYSGPQIKKVIWYNKTPSAHLTWFVEVRSGINHDWYYFIDAKDGTILRYYDNVKNDGPTTGTGTDLNGINRTFGTYLLSGTYYMIDASQPMFNATASKIPDEPVGAIVALDLRNADLSSQSSFYYVTSTNNSWADSSTVSAQYNASVTYNFYRSRFNRNSIDDSGMTIYSIVHVTDKSQPMENAYWNGFVMAYGDGAVFFKPLAGGLDVAAHEMTHGVTQHTANLEYLDQSGALNESMSDVFAATLDSANWTIGEDVVKDLVDFPTGALRDLSNPHNGGNTGSASWQPANMNEFVNTTKDKGGVHTNSGIPNHAFYLAASSIGRYEASQIWYKALTNYLTRSSQFVDARIATVNAATELYGQSSNEVTVIKNSWDAVGVTESSGTPLPPASQVVGPNYLLLTNTDSNDSNSIYMTKTVAVSNADFFPLSKTLVLTKPAVSDDGKIVLFVDKDYRLRALYTDPSNPQEQFIDTNRVWWSVAIGPGLSSLAMTSIYTDTTIYYFDLTANQSKQFKIVEQSFDGPPTNTALYADALSFDPTGEYLLFDAYNQLKSSQSDSIHYWNIGLLDVNTGQMVTVLPSQPQGIDVGDPSFSKTTQNRFAFDYYDEDTQNGSVFAADFNTGNIGFVVSTENVFGYPTYSSDDDTIAYHTKVLYQSATHEAVNKMPLLTDQITGSGTPDSHSVDATFPVWFAIGTRVTDVKQKPVIPLSDKLFQNYPNPFNPSTHLRFTIDDVRFVMLKIYDILGREVATLVSERKSPGTYDVQFDGSSLPSGVYFYRLQAGNFVSTKRMVLLR